MAVNNINMLLDCPVILGGSVGVYLEEFMGQLRSLARMNGRQLAEQRYQKFRQIGEMRKA